MQKYLVVIEQELKDKNSDQQYTAWIHTFSKSTGDAVPRARAKANGKILRAWTVDWKDPKAEPQQIMGMNPAQGVLPAAVTSILESIKGQGKLKQPQQQETKPRIRAKPTPPKPEVYFPYELVPV